MAWRPSSGCSWIYVPSDPYSPKAPIPLTASEVRSWALRRLSEVHEDQDTDPIARAVALRQALSIGLLIPAPERLRAFIGFTVGEVNFINSELLKLACCRFRGHEARAVTSSLQRQTSSRRSPYASYDVGGKQDIITCRFELTDLEPDDLLSLKCALGDVDASIVIDGVNKPLLGVVVAKGIGR